jgi:gliding motility-associated-like protein
MMMLKRILPLLLITICMAPRLVAQVVINEVMHYPSTGQGMVATGTEYVELFNTNPCQAADISCFIIGCADNDGGIVNNAGSIVIPAGTTIPPYGHYVIGTSTSSANAAAVDLQTNNNTGNYCSVGNFVLANGDGWVALYNASGIPVDALYWTVSAGEATKITGDTDFDDNPCTPPVVAGCGAPGAALPSARQIYQTYPATINYVGQYVNANTISRIPDGGTWTRAVAPSINDLTVGNCNGGTCLTPSGITFTASKTNPGCATNNGSIGVNVTSVGTATFTWSANAATGNSNTATNLGAGTYSVTITQNGCTKDTSINLSAPISVVAALTNPVNPTCAGNNGSVTAGVSGGTAPYNVTVDTGGTPFSFTLPFAASQILANLDAGAISVTVTDGAGCTSNASVTLVAPTNCCALTLSAAITQPTCGQSNGSIAITPANGLGTYAYQWGGGQTTSPLNNLAAGVYTLTLTDNGTPNCFIDTSFTLNSNSSLNATLTNPVNPTCSGSNGSVTAGVSGGTAPYNVTVDTGGTPFSFTLPFAASQTFANQDAGVISLAVTDGAGCSANASVTLVAPTNCCALTLSAAITQPTCGQSNGSIAITPANGLGTYAYQWGGGQTTNPLNNLAAGVYTLTLTDNGTPNCFIDTSFTLNSNSSLNVALLNPVNPTCAGNDGALTLSLSGGTAPYNLTVDTGSSSFSITSPAAGQFNQTGLPAGNIAVSVTDAGGCSANATATLSAPANCCTFIVSATTTSPGCGASNGSINLTTTNGSGNYGYTWGAGQTASTLNNLPAGNYPVTITDNAFAGCSIDTLFTLSNPNSPTINSINILQETCAGTADGSITIGASGGTGALSYQWTANAATGNLATATNLTAGVYGFTVSDANNCQTSSSATIQSGICCTLNAAANTTPTTCGLTNGGITVTATNGALPYTYAINNAATQPDSFFTQLAGGTYKIVVSDVNGCKDSVNVTVAASSNTLNLSVSATNVTCNGGTDGGALAAVTGGTTPYQYSWSNSATDSTIQLVAAAVYTVTVSGADGCSVTGSATVSEPVALTISLGSDTTFCTGTINLAAPAGLAAYIWSTGDTTTTITTGTAGTYTVTVTNAAGCTANASINVTQGIPGVLDLGPDITIYEGDNTSLSPVIVPPTGGSYLWQPAATLSCNNCSSPIATPVVSTTYSLVYTSANNCTVSDSITVEVVPVGNVFFPTGFSPNGDGNNDIYRVLGGGAKFLRLQIFNRWGEKVFESNNINEGWDGTYREVPQPMEVYVYLATVTLLNNQTRDYKGSITLIR